MPIPTPRTGESKDRFVERCMGDALMVKEYEASQRAAICLRQWREAEHAQAESSDPEP